MGDLRVGSFGTILAAVVDLEVVLIARVLIQQAVA
jgi:hypothetical protein